MAKAQNQIPVRPKPHARIQSGEASQRTSAGQREEDEAALSLECEAQPLAWTIAVILNEAFVDTVMLSVLGRKSSPAIGPASQLFTCP